MIRLCLALAIVAALLVPATGARAADPQVGQTLVQSVPAVASDLYAFGGGVDIQADVQGDLVAAGGRVVTAGRVLAVLALANQVPYLGGMLMGVALLMGLGAMSLRMWRHWDDDLGRADR